MWLLVCAACLALSLLVSLGPPSLPRSSALSRSSAPVSVSNNFRQQQQQQQRYEQPQQKALNKRRLETTFPLKHLNLTSYLRKEDTDPIVFCSEHIFDNYGFIDIGKMLYQCSDNIPSVLFPPSYFSSVNQSAFKSVNISVQIAVNSLLSVDDLKGTVTLDFYWRILWVDPRLQIDIWSYIHPTLTNEGIEISNFIRNEGDPLNIWLPDLFFFESTSQEVVDELIKLLPGGLMYWSRHIVGEYSQREMVFHSYPLDKQNFSFSMQSFAYESDFIRLEFIDNQAIEASNNAGNELWTFRDYSAYIDNLLDPSPTNPARRYSTAFVTLSFDRESRGIVYRLALPVMIFLVVVGASFWAAEEQRIDITLQVLLLVSALYVVIGQSIPFVGYLTLMDNFVNTVFILLAFTVSVHFAISTMHRKVEKYPMDLFYAELMVFFFRVVWLPMSVGIFAAYFHIDTPILAPITLFLFSVFLIYAYFKRERIWDTLRASILKVYTYNYHQYHFYFGVST
jgi:hypothetical protein